VKVKLLIGALVFLIVLNLATIGSFVYTQWNRGGDRALPERFAPDAPRAVARNRGEGERARRSMPVPPGKRAELRRLLSELREETEELRSRTATLEEKVLETMRLDPVPRTELDSLLSEIAAARLEISRKATEKLIEARTHLTPEQLEHFYEMVLRSRPDHSGGYYRQRYDGREQRQKNRRGPKGR
jgi:hypothetical protein